MNVLRTVTRSADTLPPSANADGKAPALHGCGALARLQRWMALTALMVAALLAPPPALSQWLGTPPFIESAPRAEREAPFRARLLNLSDGDSFTVRAEDGRRVPVRLSAIDAPEKNQPHGDVSRRALAALLEDKTLTVIPIKRDPYGRTVARVLVGDTDVGLEQVRAGMAWHYKRYESEQSMRERRDYTLAEERARAAATGLWSAPDPLPPWRFRDMQRRKQGAASPTPRTGPFSLSGAAAV